MRDVFEFRVTLSFYMRKALKNASQFNPEDISMGISQKFLRICNFTHDILTTFEQDKKIFSYFNFSFRREIMRFRTFFEFLDPIPFPGTSHFN